jgi:hypothetical protein
VLLEILLVLLQRLLAAFVVFLERLYVVVLCGSNALSFVEAGFDVCEFLLELVDLRFEAVGSVGGGGCGRVGSCMTIGN